MKKINDEVFYAQDTLVKVSRKDISELKQKADAAKRQRSRLCTHNSINDKLHEMLIIHKKNTYVRPHKHFNKSESFHIVEGLVDVVVYEDDGQVREIIPLGDYKSGRSFFYRINDPLYHTVLIRSDFAVIHETTNGPFNREETAFAPWSPPETEIAAAKKFMEQLTAVAPADGQAATGRKR